MSVPSDRRFTRNHPCPICGGHDGMPRGQGTRCHGFLSSDGRFAHCTREARAPGLQINPESGTYAHRLDAPCDCGGTHAPIHIQNPKAGRVLREQDFDRCPHPYPCDYRDENGVAMYRVARWPDREGGKDYACFHPNGPGQWLAGLDGARRVIYRLPETRAAILRGETVYIAEGEKCVHALIALSICATTNHGGAGKWRDEHTAGLRDVQRVVVFRDEDEPGRKHADEVATALHAAGAPDIRLPMLPGLPEGEDVADWLERRQPRTPEEVRAELEHLVEATKPWQPSGSTASSRKRSPWAAIQSAADFLGTPEPDGDFLEPRLLARGSLTLVFSPRGLGKTHVAHALAAKLARSGRRVLLIDRDNSRRELKRRLRGWGAADLASLKVLDRDDAPPLTDKQTWTRFPLPDYDLVLIDSLDSSTEGVGEQDSARSSLALAPLLDIAHTAAGPAVLVLGNTIKSGAHGRGCGIIEDRADIVFEVRDATDLRPTGTKAWWLELPPADRGSWADRASRRKRRDRYRLGFVPSKFRIGEEPDPFVFEVRLAGEAWTCTDVTVDIVAAGERSVLTGEQEKVTRLEAAVTTLRSEVETRADAPLLVREDAVPFLMRLGLSRDDARRVVKEHNGRDWRISGGGLKGHPETLSPPESGDADGPRGQRAETRPIPAEAANTAPPASTSTEAAIHADPRKCDSGEEHVERNGVEDSAGMPATGDGNGKRVTAIPGPKPDPDLPGFDPRTARRLRESWELIDERGTLPQPGAGRASAPPPKSGPAGDCPAGGGP